MRYLMGLIALAPFIVLLGAMIAGRARVRACCAPITSAEVDEP